MKPMRERPKLYTLCGVSGSGKTTFATGLMKAFEPERGVLYLNPDQFYALYNGDEKRHCHEFEIWMALFRALHMAEQDGRDVLLDTNAPSLVDRAQLLDWFPGFEHHLIAITATPELCRKNNLSRDRVVPEEEMERMIRRFQIPTPDEDPRYRSVTVFENRDNNGFHIKEHFHREEGAT